MGSVKLARAGARAKWTHPGAPLRWTLLALAARCFRGLPLLVARAPFAFAILYSGAKTAGADLAVQTWVEKKTEIDKRRTAVFFGFGLVQVGFVQYLLYSKLFPHFFSGSQMFAAKTLSDKLADRQGLLTVAKQVGLDQFVYHPLMYFPVFYTCKELIRGESANPFEVAKSAMRQYQQNVTEDLVALWKLYIPVSILQFSLVPIHWRVPFVATVGIVWCAILSKLRGSDPKDRAAEALERMRGMDPKEVAKKLQLVQENHAARGSQACSDIDQARFAEMMLQSGLLAPGEDVASALFEILDSKRRGRLPGSEFMPGMLMLLGRGRPEGRLSDLPRQSALSTSSLDERQRLREILRCNPLFASLPSAELEIVLSSMQKTTFSPQSTILKEGELGDCLYVIQAGSMNCTKNIDGSLRHVRTLSAGDVFGENALIYDCPRFANVVANETCECWSLDRTTFASVVKAEVTQRRNKFSSIMNLVLLASKENDDRTHVLKAMRVETFRRGHCVVSQGDIGSKFFTVADGQLRVVQRSPAGDVCELGTYRKGDYFGELALLLNHPSGASIIVESQTATLHSLSREAFHDLSTPAHKAVYRALYVGLWR